MISHWAGWEGLGRPVSQREEYGGLKTSDRTETLACHSSSLSLNFHKTEIMFLSSLPDP